jgi:hypothetical protein
MLGTHIKMRPVFERGLVVPVCNESIRLAVLTEGLERVGVWACYICAENSQGYPRSVLAIIN